jgi:hypothetical protein
MNRIKCFFLKETGRHAREVGTGYTADYPLYSDPEGRIFTLGHRSFTDADGTVIQPAPVGAMWDADWYRGVEGSTPGDDGLHLIVRTPGGDWVVDGTSWSPRWQRTGVVPCVTATPSIHFPGVYHGWLRAGYLEEC